MKERNLLRVKKGVAILTIMCFVNFEIGSIFCMQEVSAAVKGSNVAVDENFTQIDYRTGILSENKNGELEIDKIEKDYRELVTKYEKKGYVVNLSWDEYEETILQGMEIDIYSYLEKPKTSTTTDSFLMKQSSNMLRSSGDRSSYYYNTGTKRPFQCNYSKYYLLSKAKKGDIFYKANGGKGITGHVGIVEGKYYVTNGGYYIRIIEATPGYGVKRGVLDDTRADEGDVTLLRPIVRHEVIKPSVEFCVSQLGKGYDLDFNKDYSKSEKDWYCSELVWAGYKNQGVDLETTGSLNEPGITPRDLLRSDKTATIDMYHSSK